MKNLKRVFSEFIEFAGYTKFFFFVFVTIFVAAVAMLEPQVRLDFWKIFNKRVIFC